MSTRTFLSRLDFFNPSSKTGVFFNDDPDYRDMQTVQSQIFPTDYSRESIFFGFKDTWNILMGKHYQTGEFIQPIKKGLLDFLIFPMLPLLIQERGHSDSFLLRIAQGLSIAVLEIMRVLAAVILFIPAIIALNIGVPIFAIGCELFAFAMQRLSSSNSDSSEEIFGLNMENGFGLSDNNDDSASDDSDSDEEVIFKLPTYGSIN